MMKLSETQFFRLKSGCEKTQRDFVKNTWRDAYALSFSILRDENDASEVTSDVISDFVLKYIQNFNHSRAIPSYVRAMISQRACRFRDQKTFFTALNDADLIDMRSLSPEDATHYSCQIAKLESCIAHLTPKAQQVVKMKYYLQMTNEEIGQVVGHSKQHVGRIIKKSTKLLRGCLKKTFQ